MTLSAGAGPPRPSPASQGAGLAPLGGAPPAPCLGLWGRVLATVGRLDPLDRWMIALRVVALLGGLAWWALHPLPSGPRRALLWLFGAFVAYSAVLYMPPRLRALGLARLYRVAMVLDLGFIFVLVRLTGGMASNFYLAFYLLIALHAFYFGLRVGAGVALAASVLYVFTGTGLTAIDPSDVGLRVAFFWLVGICMGSLAERERGERQRVEALNAELLTQQRSLRDAQEQLIRSDRLATVGELASGLAHDLRNPLAGIAGALHVLAGQLPVGDGHALLAEIQAQIGRMNKTLTDLLWHARPPTPQYLPLNVNEVLDQSLLFLPMASGTEIALVRELHPDLPMLRLDPNLLHQAFLNILINARQAMPGGGRLTVRTGIRGNGVSTEPRVEVTIADTGAGIPPEHLPHIFEPFFTTKAQGTGLGLAIATRIVAQHGGTLTVDSAVGQGTAFRISFPVPAEPAEGDSRPPA